MSVLATILASTEGAEESSKTAFYLAGGALAVWAVLVGLVGIARPSFAGTTATARVSMLVTVALVAAALVTAVLTG